MDDYLLIFQVIQQFSTALPVNFMKDTHDSNRYQDWTRNSYKNRHLITAIHEFVTCKLLLHFQLFQNQFGRLLL